jgi:hypothetical protein
MSLTLERNSFAIEDIVNSPDEVNHVQDCGDIDGFVDQFKAYFQEQKSVVLNEVIEELVIHGGKVESMVIETWAESKHVRDYVLVPARNLNDCEGKAVTYLSKGMELAKMKPRAIFIILHEPEELAEVHIDTDYHIYLSYRDIFKEIPMFPLEKCIFFLYLYNEEGLAYKDLTQYKAELVDIYTEITKTKRRDTVLQKIDKLLNFKNNSFYEKVSRIKMHFVKLLGEEKAVYYSIVGGKKEKKRIVLPRDKIKFIKKTARNSKRLKK